MNGITDKEYLSKPKLAVQFLIKDDLINISSEHTTYVGICRDTRIVKEDVLANYKEIIKLAKQQGVKISYKNHFKKQIEENWEVYREQLKQSFEIYEKIVEKCKELEKRGLHQGTSDDYKLSEVVKLVHEYNQLYYRNTILSKIKDLNYNLKRLREELSRANSLCQIFL